MGISRWNTSCQDVGNSVYRDRYRPDSDSFERFQLFLASRSSRVTLDRFTLLQTVPRGQRPDTYPFRRTTFHSTFVSVCLRNAEQTSRVTRFVVFRRASYVSSIRIRCPSPISPSKADQLLLPPPLFLLCAHLNSRIAKRGREQGTFITIRC